MYIRDVVCRTKDKRKNMAEKTALPTIPLLRGDNYYNWRVKMESMLQLKRLLCVLIQDRPTGDNKRKEKAEFDEKNADAVHTSFIK